MFEDFGASDQCFQGFKLDYFIWHGLTMLGSGVFNVSLLRLVVSRRGLQYSGK